MLGVVSLFGLGVALPLLIRAELDRQRLQDALEVYDADRARQILVASDECSAHVDQIARSYQDQQQALLADLRMQRAEWSVQRETLTADAEVGRLECLLDAIEVASPSDEQVEERGELVALRDEFEATRERMGTLQRELRGIQDDRERVGRQLDDRSLRIAEKDKTIGDLKVRLEELELRVSREGGKQAAFRWAAFAARAVLQVCGPAGGPRGRRCREDVPPTLSLVESDWLACVENEGVAPELEVWPAGQRWPRPHRKVWTTPTQTWWVMMCDPALSESPD